MSHALLIDGENLSCTHAAAILGAMPPDAPVRRVYGDVVRLNGWLSVGGLRAVHTSQGKNAADMQIAIDAMEFLLRDGIRNFAIATSDGDFIPLFARLRESGACVTLFGSEKASKSLRKIAHRFVRLALPKPTPPKPTPPPPGPVDMISQWIGNGIPMAQLSIRLQKERPRDLSTWLGTAGPRSFVERHPERFVVDRTGSQAIVRLVRDTAPPPTP